MTEERNKRKVVTGVVTSDKMDQTIAVTGERLVKHPVFGKYVKRFSKYKAHDENNVAVVGDVVKLVECRPYSKTKHFRLLEVVRHGKGHAPVIEEEIV
ncbi:MAG: 30S ribosomal protein S17 [Pirellulaceae bacterium]|jgi:small subunit ribosomal protein S17|nr:30S ribosomal protein S17 [Pirellulaceae bacterium]